MRVISQCGTMDIPYESVVLSLVDNGNGCSVMAFSECLSNGVTVARYSNDENAKKAMDLLHKTYVGKMFLTVNENVEFDNTAKELLKNATILCTPNVDVRPIGDSRNVVFRFPADDEI